MKVLGIETSCDDTGVAIFDATQGLLGHMLYSQAALHQLYGGVVPELASRDHILKLLPLIKQLLKKTQLTSRDIQGVAYTVAPGLAGALLVGACLGRGLAFAWNVPAIGVHHLEAHLLAVMLEKQQPEFPFLALLVSGGHSLLVEVQTLGRYRILGDTRDDAVGEAFDKTAKLLGLPYPGGAALAELALQGRSGRFRFPRPMLHSGNLDFSFSGLKTFAINTLQQAGNDLQTKADVAKAFEEAVVETLVTKCQRALQQTKLQRLVIAGGVGANQALRAAMTTMTKALDVELFYPRAEFCTDNGAMIAYTGCQRLLRGERDELVIKVQPRWSLEDLK